VRNKFPNVSDAIIKKRIGPQFDEDPNETERNAWLSFKKICKNVLGNHKAAYYQDVVQTC
jgi:hypothetical protein